MRAASAGSRALSSVRRFLRLLSWRLLGGAGGLTQLQRGEMRAIQSTRQPLRVADGVHTGAKWVYSGTEFRPSKRCSPEEVSTFLKTGSFNYTPSMCHARGIK